MLEDSKLRLWVQTKGAQKWTECSQFINGRSGKQCRERWLNKLNPKLKKGKWSQEEDKIIFKVYQIHGTTWSKIAAEIPGRTENQIKNRFYSTIRKISRMTKTMKTNVAEQFSRQQETLFQLLRNHPSVISLMKSKTANNHTLEKYKIKIKKKRQERQQKRNLMTQIKTEQEIKRMKFIFEKSQKAKTMAQERLFRSQNKKTTMTQTDPISGIPQQQAKLPLICQPTQAKPTQTIQQSQNQSKFCQTNTDKVKEPSQSPNQDIMKLSVQDMILLYQQLVFKDQKRAQDKKLAKFQQKSTEIITNFQKSSIKSKVESISQAMNKYKFLMQQVQTLEGMLHVTKNEIKSLSFLQEENLFQTSQFRKFDLTKKHFGQKVGFKRGKRFQRSFQPGIIKQVKRKIYSINLINSGIESSTGISS